MKRANEDRALESLGTNLAWLSRHADVLPGDVVVVEIRLKVTHDEGAEHMAVVKAWTGGSPVVGFVSAPSLDMLVHLVVAKLMNGSMKWREDRPYGK